jgi:hypothetical protein
MDLDNLNSRLASSIDALKPVLLNGLPVDSEMRNSIKLTLFPTFPRLKPSHIGKLSWRLTRDEFLNLQATTIDLKDHTKYPIAITSVNNDRQLAVVDYSTGSLYSLNNSFTIVEKFGTDFNGESIDIRPSRMESNGESQLYILDKQSNQIYLLDCLSTQTSAGLFGKYSIRCVIGDERRQASSVQQFRDICFSIYHNRLYAQVKSNWSIVRVYMPNGEFKSQIELGWTFNSQHATSSSSLKVTSDCLVLLFNLNEFGLFSLSTGCLMVNLKCNQCVVDSYCLLDEWTLVYLNNTGELIFEDLSKMVPVSAMTRTTTTESYSSLFHLNSKVLITNDFLRTSDSNSMIFCNKKLIICFPWKQTIVVLS